MISSHPTAAGAREMDVAIAHATVDIRKNAMHVPPAAKVIRAPWLAASSSIPTQIQLVIPGMTEARQCAMAICQRGVPDVRSRS